MSTLFALYSIASLGCASPALGAPLQVWQPPYDNLTALEKDTAPPWVSAPLYRGTFEILYSCTFTLALCVYTAIHLNVPLLSRDKTAYFRTKTKWALIALIAPEVVLYTAWYQWYEARNFFKKFNNLQGPSKAPAGPPISPAVPKNTPSIHTVPVESGQSGTNQARSLDLKDGFYAVMGGYVVDIPEARDSTQPGSTRRRSTLTPEGILELARRGRFPIASKQTIDDKSKADFLAKFLVCFQVSFLVIQSLARKISGYPLTLLEVHTLVHVVCALLMYAFWFRKPLDIHDPIVVEATNTVMQCLQDEIPDQSLYLCTRARNIKVTEPGTGTRSSRVLLLLCAAYGGIHTSAWNFIFPTTVEHILWKASCICAVCGSCSALGWAFLSGADTKLDAYKRQDLRGVLAGSIQDLRRFFGNVYQVYEWSMLNILNVFIGSIMLLLFVVGLLMTPLFLLARVYIVVEAFVSMRMVPAGAYANVQWAQWIPHI